jgi:hypothetical protein
MDHKTNLTFFGLLLLVIFTNAQAPAPKQLPAKRTVKPVKIDGLIDDEAWKDAAVMADLVEFRPKVGDKEIYANRTITYLMYNDEGIYFGGYCYEQTKDSIARELAGRDGFGTNDYIGIIFDTYNDKLNGFEYFVTPLNEQWDAKMSPPSPNTDSEDFTWNSVWQSGAVIHNDGWSFEMFIPYSAIRFGKKEVQTWGLNITRRRRKTEEQFTWNPIDPSVNGFLTQEGYWTDISNIKPPLRLQFSPYFSTYVNHYPSNVPGKSNWTSSVNGGMDVKYGISQAMTLDMTLIPDFGQVQSDNQVLNLTPFEVRYNEYRPFFTEGTELFGKGNLFYSRRVGGTPLHFYDLGQYMSPDEHVIKNPRETKLINATKVSGRLQNGLGIGFFNAVTNPQYAVVEDNSGNQRKIETNPLTNYNIIVLNQSMKNNSSLSFVNTNVWRSGADYDANVTAALFDLNDKKNTWNVGGKAALSNKIGYLPGGKNETGYSHNLYFGKTSGKFRFNLNQDLTDTKFNSNDLGYFTFNNYLDHYLWMGWQWLKPTKWYNNFRLNVNSTYSRLQSPITLADKSIKRYRSAFFNVNVNGQLKNLWFVGAFVGYEPEYNDFNEPRLPDKVFRGWQSRTAMAWFESNYAKKYSVSTQFMYVSRTMFKSKRYQLNFSQRFRFNDKFSITHNMNLEPQKRNAGFADHYYWDAVAQDYLPSYSFGRRDIATVENVLVFKYSFNAKMNVNTRVRHYWRRVEYDELFDLQVDGKLKENNYVPSEANQNYNIVTVDAVFTWQYAPGSFINLVWKNNTEAFNRIVNENYFKNFGNTIETDQNNNISLKVIYFLDYLQLKKKKTKN